MVDLNEFEGAGERFKFLLQPVKDLAANWNLDIAKTLDDYIRKVREEINDPETASQTDEHGRHKLFNFAEAAMLIHGTTTVYVRKVDYVLQQAQNFFEQLREDNSRNAQKGKRRKGNVEDEGGNVDGAGDDDANDENIDPNAGEHRKQRRQTKVNYAALRQMLERLSQRPPSLLPVVPIAFFPLSDFEKSDVPLCARTNAKEVVGKKDDFKINSCHIHESVALLDLKNIQLLHQFSQLSVNSQQNNVNRVTGTALEPLMERTIEEDFEASSRSHIESAIIQAQNGQRPSMEGVEDNGSTHWNENDGGEDDSVHTELATAIEGTQEEMDEEELGRLRSDQLNSRPPTQQFTEDTIRPSGDLVVHSRPISTVLLEMDEEQNEDAHEGQQNEARQAEGKQRMARQKEPDWEEQLRDLLDPMEPSTERCVPFVRKENCVMNAAKQIKARDRRIERDCREKGVPNMASVKCYIDTHIYRHKLKRKAYAFGMFNSFLVDQAVHALNPLIHAEEKRRMELRKRRRKEAQIAERAARAALRNSHQRELDPVLDHPIDDDEVEGPQEQQQQQPGEQNDNRDEFDDPIDELVAEEIINLPPGEDWASDAELADDHNLGDILDVEDLENSLGGVQNLYAGFDHLTASQKKKSKMFDPKNLNRNFYDDTVFVGSDLNPEDLPPRPVSQMDYDEIIAFHLRKYWTASEEAVSAFSERIQQWEARMSEVLEKEQSHRNFSTSAYGGELLDRFNGQIGDEIDFSKMLSELPNDYDQSRYLLVSLILTNLGNVEIKQENAEETILLRLNKRVDTQQELTMD